MCGYSESESDDGKYVCACACEMRELSYKKFLRDAHTHTHTRAHPHTHFTVGVQLWRASSTFRLLTRCLGLVLPLPCLYILHSHNFKRGGWLLSEQ